MQFTRNFRIIQATHYQLRTKNNKIKTQYTVHFTYAHSMDDLSINQLVNGQDWSTRGNP